MVNPRCIDSTRRFTVLIVAVSLASMLLSFTSRAKAVTVTAQLTPVTGFGSNPGNLLMFEWIPPDLPPNAPLVMILHGCFTTAAQYDDETGWTELASQWKVALAFPQQTALNDPTHCFRWWNTDDITRGQGEALSIKQMVDWMHANHGTDPTRTYIMGHSGGGLFTSVMLATYPDVFKAGAIVAGGPYKCGGEQECTDGTVNKASKEWGALARSGFPGYKGPKPRVSIWQGTADSVVSPKNFHELVEQWTSYHGVDMTPDVADTVKGYPHNVYRAPGKHGIPLVESYSLTGQSHGWPYDPGTGEDQCDGAPPSWDAGICGAYFAGRWFGLG